MQYYYDQIAGAAAKLIEQQHGIVIDNPEDTLMAVNSQLEDWKPKAKSKNNPWNDTDQEFQHGKEFYTIPTSVLLLQLKNDYDVKIVERKSEGGFSYLSIE